MERIFNWLQQLFNDAEKAEQRRRWENFESVYKLGVAEGRRFAELGKLCVYRRKVVRGSGMIVFVATGRPVPLVETARARGFIDGYDAFLKGKQRELAN